MSRINSIARQRFHETAPKSGPPFSSAPFGVRRKAPHSISYVLTICCFVVGGARGETDALDLTQAIEMALEQNRSLMMAGLDMGVRQAAIREQEAEFSFRLEGAGRAGVADEQDTAIYGLGLTRTLPTGTEVGVRTEYGRNRFDSGEFTEWQSRVRIEIGQPLFRGGGRLVTLEPVTAARSRLRAAERAYHALESDLLLAVVERYLALEILERQIEVDEQAVDRLARVLKIARARERSGKQTRVDTLRVELELGQADARLENSRRRLITTQQAFADLLGFPQDTVVELEASPFLELDLPDIGSAMLVALQHRLDLAQAMQDHDDTRRGERIVRRDLRPDIRLAGFYDFLGRGETSSDARRLDDSDWFLGVTLGSDWLPARERARVEGALLSAQQAALNVEDTQYRIALEVRERIEECRRTRGEHEIALRNAELAERRQRLATRLYSSGRGTNFDLIDAETALTQAEIQRYVTEAEVTVASYRLLHSIGTLLEYPETLRPTHRGQPL